MAIRYDEPQAVRNYDAAGSAPQRETRAVEGITERMHKLDAQITHAIGQATGLRSRLLGEREPAQIGKASSSDKVQTPPSCDLDELRKVVVGCEGGMQMLIEHLERLDRV